MSDYRQFVLDNGLRVMLRRTPTETLAGRVRVHCGALRDPEGKHGLVHLLEHALIYAGTRSLTPQQSTALVNGSRNMPVATYSDSMQFGFQSFPEDVADILNVYADMIFHPRFDADAIDAERKRVVREIGETREELRMDDKKYEELLMRNYPQRISSHRVRVSGDVDVVRSTSVEELRELHAHYFNATNADIVLVGSLPENIEELLRTHFGDKPAGALHQYAWPSIEPLDNATGFRVAAPYLTNRENPDESNTHVKIGFIAPSYTAAEAPAFIVLNQILGGRGGRLQDSLSQVHGLAYFAKSFHNPMPSAQYCEIEARVADRTKKEAVDLVFDITERLRTEDVSQEELAAARSISRLSFALQLECNQMSVHALELKLDYYELSVAHLLASVQRVTPADVRAVAHKYLPRGGDGNYVLMVREPAEN